jgi:hypothetical protein
MFGYTASLSLIGLHEQACFGCASEPNLLSHIIKFLTKTDSNNDGQNTDAFPSFALRTVDASQVQKWWSPTLRGKSKMLQALLSFLRQSPLPCSSARRRIRPPQPSPAALKTPPVGDGGIFLLGGRSAACRTTRQASEPVHGEARQGPQWSDPVTPDFTGKTECISYVRQDHLHTHDRQNESNTIAVIKRTRV